VTLLGPSGSGKTSTLRLVGGFEELDAGAIRINGERIDHLPPYQRDTSTIFQSGALFPHKTVAENVAYGLRMRKVAKPEMAERIRQSLDLVRLKGFEDRFPSQLSGGQQQRVALARSLAVRPAILLFDEPLSALDLSLRLQLRAESSGCGEPFSAIYVTHDQGEAMAMSSRVAVMNKGRIEQIGRPEAIFHEPVNEFVYTFIGESCCLPVQLGAGGAFDKAGQRVELLEGQACKWRLAVLYPAVAAEARGRPPPCQPVKAKIHFIEFLGDVYRYHLKAGALEIFADHGGSINHGVGDEIDVSWRSEDMKAFQ
jgi:ABC-type Fe3+/spermidine/putrescine transport system ATPase subunit